VYCQWVGTTAHHTTVTLCPSTRGQRKSTDGTRKRAVNWMTSSSRRFPGFSFSYIGRNVRVLKQQSLHSMSRIFGIYYLIFSLH